MKQMLALLLVLALLPTGLAFSQRGFADLGFAYGFGSGTQFITNTISAGNQTGVYGSYGEGFRFGVTGGYMFNKNFGAQFGFMYILGKSFDGDGPNNAYKLNISGSGFLFVPGVILSMGNERGIDPYARFGIALGFLKQTVKATGANLDYESNASGGITLGVLAGVGAAYSITHMFSIYGEITVLSLTQNPSTLEITKHMENGQTAQDQGKKFDYKDTFDQNNAAQNTRLSVRNPFGSIGITIGGRVNF